MRFEEGVCNLTGLLSWNDTMHLFSAAQRTRNGEVRAIPVGKNDER